MIPDEKGLLSLDFICYNIAKGKAPDPKADAKLGFRLYKEPPLLCGDGRGILLFLIFSVTKKGKNGKYEHCRSQRCTEKITVDNS